MVGTTSHWLRKAGRRGVLLAAVAGALTLAAGPAAARGKTKEEKPLIGTPQVVQDLHWGDVLFYFYQGDYLQSLTRLGASQDLDRITPSRRSCSRAACISRSASTRRPAASSARCSTTTSRSTCATAHGSTSRRSGISASTCSRLPTRWLRSTALCPATWSPSVICS